MRPHRIALLLAALLVVGPAAPRPAAANSRYSLYGHGESIPATGSQARAQGGAEAAGTEPGIAGNPASIALADRTLFMGSYETQWVRTQEGVGSSLRVRRDYEGLVPNLSLVFPLGRTVGLGLGILVDRRKGGRIVSDAVTPGADSQGYRQIYEARGNLLRIPVLLAGRAGRLRWGTGVDVLLLNQRTEWQNDFPRAAESLGFRDSDDLDQTSMWGAAWRVGLRMPVREWGALGGWLSLPGDLSGTQTVQNNDGNDSDDLEIDRTGEVPVRWGVGFDAIPGERFRVRGDVVREQWGDVKTLSPLDELVDVTRIAVGGEWIRGRGTVASDLEELEIDTTRGRRWPLRLGYRTELLHARDRAADTAGPGRTNREHVFTLGSGFGFAGGRGAFDWHVEYGWHGEKDASEYYEQFVRFGMTLTGIERWTRRRSPAEEDDGDW